jgi:hypothetical protein
VIELEEQHIHNLFTGYATYAASVPALRPQWPANSSPGGAAGRFRLALYIRNQEYQSSAAFLAAALLLAWKVYR